MRRIQAASKWKSCVRNLLPRVVIETTRRFIRNSGVCMAKIKIKLALPLKKTPKDIYFGIHLTEHCNLNCRGCDNFSPVAEPEFIGVEEFKRDMERMGELFQNKCRGISLLGGEPLLHPDIITLMKIARKNFPFGKIGIVTNGILLPKKEEKFWSACHIYNVEIRITRYPIKIDPIRIVSLAEKFAVKLLWEGSGVVKTMSFVPLNLAGEGDNKINFAICGRAVDCAQLSHGRLFTCSFIPNVRHFNKAFNANIPVTEMDYIDIYQNNIDKDMILQKLCEPVPICRYCDILGMRGGIQWSVSKKSINEWV